MSAQACLFSRGGGKRSGKRNGFGWKRGTDRNVKALGEFATRLGRYVLGGVISEGDSPDCDIWVDGFDAGVESKAGSSRDGTRVRIKQLDSHLGTIRAGFPYSRYWYFFLRYRNWGRNGKGQRCRLFQETVRSESDVPGFLGKNTVGLYVLDISVVDAIRNRQKPVTVYNRNGRIPATPIGWRFFDQLKSEQGETLRALGLKQSDYWLHLSSVKTMFEGRQMEFEFLAMLEASVSPRQSADLFRLGVEKQLAFSPASCG